MLDSYVLLFFILMFVGNLFLALYKYFSESSQHKAEEIYNKLINNDNISNSIKHNNYSILNYDDDTNYCTDPRYSFLSCNIFHHDDDFSSDFSYNSSDICTDSAYSFLDCNIFHDDSFSSSWDSFNSWDSYSSWDDSFSSSSSWD